MTGGDERPGDGVDVVDRCGVRVLGREAEVDRDDLATERESSGDGDRDRRAAEDEPAPVRVDDHGGSVTVRRRTGGEARHAADVDPPVWSKGGVLLAPRGVGARSPLGDGGMVAEVDRGDWQVRRPGPGGARLGGGRAGAGPDARESRHGISSTFPVVVRLSSSRCASAAPASGTRAPTRTSNHPSAIQPKTSAARPSRSSRVSR